MLDVDGYGLIPVSEVEPEHLNRFTCGIESLDEYLRNSHDAHSKRISHTTVVFHQDYATGPVGYFTLSNDSIKLKSSEVSEFGLDDFGSLGSYPAVKLGRFAISNDLQGKGVGPQLLRFVQASILDMTYRSAARLIVVDAANRDGVPRFYEKNGYVSSLWAEDQVRNHGGRSKNTAPETVKMIKDVMTVD